MEEELNGCRSGRKRKIDVYNKVEIGSNNVLRGRAIIKKKSFLIYFTIIILSINITFEQYKICDTILVTPIG